MDWMATIGDSWLTTLAWLAGLAVAFGILGRLMPCNPGMYWWNDLRAVATDFIYWFVVPLFLRAARLVLLVAGVVLLCGGREPRLLPVKDLPLWQQCLAILLIQDILLYWAHRLFHTRLAWPFHAVHHSPTVLDWMSAMRFHPVNHLLEFCLADVAVLLLGFAPAALLVLMPINLIYSAMVHANLSWTFGPLRYVFASPVFHRWHHTTRAEGRDRNFAPTFPFLDLLFGTFHMPAGRLPDEFGTGDPDFPEGFRGQLLHPFRRRRAPAASSAEPERRATGRRPGALKAAAVLTVLSLAGGGMYVAARRTERAEPPPQEALQTEFPPVQTEPPRHPVPAGPSAPVLSVAVSADGRRVVSGSEDGTVKVWDAATGDVVRTLTGHTRAVCSVALSPDAKRIVSGSHDATVKVWDADTGQEKLTLRGHTSAVFGVALSGDGRRLASAGWATAKVWDANTGREVIALTGEPGSVLSVALSGDGRRLVWASWATATVWDALAGRAEYTCQGHADLVYGVALSPDGNRVVSGSLDRTARVWDVAARRELVTLTGHAGPVYGVAFSPDGKRVVTGSADRTVKVWDVATGREELTMTGHTDSVTSVAVSGDGRRLVSGSRDGTVKVWDAPTESARDAAPVARRD